MEKKIERGMRGIRRDMQNLEKGIRRDMQELEKNLTTKIEHIVRAREFRGYGGFTVHPKQQRTLF